MALDRINATALLDGGVTTADIADDAVTTAKINAGAVDTTELADDAVTSAKLDTNIAIDGDLLVGSTSSVGNANANDLELTNSGGSGVVGMTFNVNSGSANTGNIYWRSNASNNAIQISGDPITNYLAFSTSGAEKMRIDSNGNVGIAASSPAATSSTYKNLQVALAATVSGRTDDSPLYLSSNLSYNNGWKYIANTTATQIALGTNIQFFTAPSGTSGAGATLTERLRILSSGGITFNGDTAAANALDDYEEGTWTAQIIGSGTNPSSAVTMPTATYTKIGRLVFAQFQFSNVNTTGASGGVRVSGLPFAANTAHGTGNILTYVGMTFPTTSTNISPYVSGTEISFYYSTSNQGWAEITHNATSGVYLAVTVTYQTNA
jgi:hypothetical protein